MYRILTRQVSSMDVLSGAVTLLQKGFARSGARAAKKHPAPALPQAEPNWLAQPVGTCFTAGFAKADIMPDDLPQKPYWVAGYRTGNRAAGVLDPMTCSALWLDDNSGRGGVCFVSIDNVGMSSYDSDQIKASLRQELAHRGCRGLFICSCHNHAGIDTLGYWGPLPRTGRNPKYMGILYRGVRQVILNAYAGRKEGTLFHGTIDAPPVLRDTRLPEVWNNTLSRLRFVPNDGSTETWLLHFASHSEALLGKNNLVSADFPCYLRRRVLAQAGAEVIYFIGCEGGLIRPKELDEDNI
ncbi:MAG: hypothetical protein LBB50_03910, partial [Oscillospiraceae bacterium]|nr:hypothetical protein [Oscillospiraceae bacterium]